MADRVLALNAPWPLMLACMRAASPSLSIWRPEHSPLSHSSSRSLCLLSHSLPAPERVRHGKRAELPTAARFFLFLHPDSPSSARPKPAPPSPPPLPRCRAQLCPPWTPTKPKLGPPPHEHVAWPLRPAMARAEPSRGRAVATRFRAARPRRPSRPTASPPLVYA